MLGEHRRSAWSIGVNFVSYDAMTFCHTPPSPHPARRARLGPTFDWGRSGCPISQYCAFP